MHYEYRLVGNDYDIYEVDGDNEVLVVSGLTKEQAELTPYISRWARMTGMTVGELIAMLSVGNRHHIEKCRTCVFFNTQLGHCQLKSYCISYNQVHGRKRIIIIDDLIQRVKYATQEHLDTLRYVTMDGKIGDKVHTEYFQLMKHLATNENIVGGVECDCKLLHA